MWILKLLVLGFLVVFVLPAAASAAIWYFGDHATSWRTADWSSSALLPPAATVPEARVYILSARTGGLTGAVSEHSWIVVKETDAAAYERWDKVGWGTPVRHNGYPADGRWYSNEPRIVFAATGERAELLIPKLRSAIESFAASTVACTVSALWYSSSPGSKDSINLRCCSSWKPHEGRGGAKIW